MNLLVDATEGNCNELCQAQVYIHIVAAQAGLSANKRKDCHMFLCASCW